MKSDNNCFWAGNLSNLDSMLKSRHYCTDKGQYSQGYGLPSGHIGLWKLNNEEGRARKNRCLQTVVLEKTPGSPLDIKEIKPVNIKGNKPWTFVGSTDSEAETSVYGHLMRTADSLESPSCWERLRAEGGLGITGWDSLMASLIQWTWTWANFGIW